jgi:ATP phosphoribosyltransferase
VTIFIATDYIPGPQDDACDVLLVLPKNTGLKRYASIFLDNHPHLASCKVITVRGEDVPFWVEQLTKKGKRAIGLTGEDLYKEYVLKNGGDATEVLSRIEWTDDKALYEKPALCFIGPEGRSMDELPRSFTVCACGKYKTIVSTYLDKLREKGYDIDEIYVNGSVETSCSEGIADAVIDIVYSGRSIDEFGLEIYDVIFTSDCVVIGGKRD